MSGLGLTQMNSMLALQSTMKTMTTLSASRTSIDGNMRVLKSEIETDKGRGMDTARKEEEYADMESNLNTLMEKISTSAAQANDKIAAGDNEKNQEEESKETGKTTEIRKSNRIAEEPVDIVDISAFARNSTAFAPQSVPEIPAKPAAQKGAAIDVKA